MAWQATDAWRHARSLVAAVCLSALIVSVAVAQPLVIGPAFAPSSRFELSDSVQIANVESAARTQLENVRALLANKSWDEAIETLREIQSTHGDQVIAFDNAWYGTVRDYCHRQITRLPPPALALYRERVDPQAETWYQRAVKSADEPLLRRITEQLYASSRGDDALMLLGELALERGDAATARRYWQQISPLLRGPNGLPSWLAIKGDRDVEQESFDPATLFQPRSSASRWLAYPDTDLPLAEVRARLAYASILEGDLDRAKLEIQLLDQLHPNATGRLGGKQVALAKTLSTMLAASKRWPTAPSPTGWPTFAGNFARDKTVASKLRFSAQPTWSIEMSRSAAPRDKFPESGETGLNALAANTHPVISDQNLFYANGRQVFALDLKSGKPAWSDRSGLGQVYPSGLAVAAVDRPPGRHRSTIANDLGQPCHTLTQSGNLLFARLGSPVTSRPASDIPGRDGSFLVCLDLKKQGSLRWRYPIERDMPAFIEQGWAFEGAPVADGEHIYVAMRRSDVRPQSHVACFRASDGRLVWRRLIAAADTPGSTRRGEITHNLLTLHEQVLYINTNLGAVGAVDTRGGRLLWAHRYQRVTSGDLSEPRPYDFRDLNPCVFARGTLYVAPSDSEAIFALDAATGLPVWQHAPISLSESHPKHILGVAGSHLIATGRNIWWIDIATGNVDAMWPDVTGNTEIAYGRGILAGGQVYWPTREQILVFDAKPNPAGEIAMRGRIQLRRPDLPLPMTGGNLAVASGYVIITAQNRIFAFSQDKEND